MPPTRRKAPPSRTQILAGFIDKTLLPDLRARAKEPVVAETLRARWDFERAQKRTAAALPEWTDQTLTQVAVAWVLSCVFVRVLEDRDLVPHARLAGRDARDSESMFYEQFSQLGARDYVLTVFTELSRSPVTEGLLGPAVNPAWTLGPSHEAVRALLTLLRDTHADGALTLRFDDPDTRFLGDLYQDLSADVRERFALLQTPDFVETFILDHTLEPALTTFPLASLRVIDPTCGSGHFLLGALRRIFTHLRAQRPDEDPRALVTEALAKVHGSDINPYAVAVARVRLLLEVIALGKYTRLADAPALPALTRNVVVADSLLLGAKGTKDLAELAFDAASQSGWGPRAFDFQDPPAVNAVFRQRYHAVVGNPPYITCKDSALRETYRAGYPDSAQRQYALAAPFTERFFTLAADDGYVGLINANSFMKREFGKGLVETVLPRLDLTHVVDTSGAYIPGHGTPTVILFGRNRRPSTPRLRAVLGRRGEPETPEDPTKGKVWSSIAEHLGDAGFENDFVTITDVERSTFDKHPWSLGGGGAGELKELIESRCPKRLGTVTVSIGRVAHTGADEAFVSDRESLVRSGLRTSDVTTFIEGESLRDWSLSSPSACVFSYDDFGVRIRESANDPRLRYLWPHRTSLWLRREPNGTHREIGLTWYEFSRFHPERYAVGFAVGFAFVATHNHFVLDRGGKVFKQSAPIIKLPATATEADHLGLLAWLNSSTAAMLLRTTCSSKGIRGEGGGLTSALWEQFLEYSGSNVDRLAVPAPIEGCTILAKLMIDFVARRDLMRPRALLTAGRFDLDEARKYQDLSLRRLVGAQEEMDWLWYEHLGLLSDAEKAEHTAAREPPPGLDGRMFHPIAPGHRAFERAMFLAGEETAWFTRNGYARPTDDALSQYDAQTRALLDVRVSILRENKRIALLERPEYKRRWTLIDFDAELKDAARDLLLDRAEAVVKGHENPLTARDVVNALLSDETAQKLARVLFPDEVDPIECLPTLLHDVAIPYLAALRHTEEGLAKRARWEHTWDLQRREDLGESVGEIPVPPKYDREDYRDPRCWSLRGKLDVPRERFIAYPGAETDPKAPLFGWAGWDHLQRARALASVYQQRKNLDGWDAARLIPLLAGLRELHFWITLWHDAPDPDLDGARAGQVWAEFLEGERAYLGCSEDDLRAWRPAAKVRKGRAKG